LELRARRKRPSFQQPWKTHVPTVSEIDGVVGTGLAEVVLEVDVVFELVVLVEVAREVVLEIEEDVVDVDVEVEEGREDVEVSVEDRPAGPPGIETTEETAEGAERTEGTVTDVDRLVAEEPMADRTVPEEVVVGTEEVAPEEVMLEATVLEVDEDVVVVVERELADEVVEKVVHVVDVFELVLDEVLDVAVDVETLEVDAVEVVDRDAELVLLKPLVDAELADTDPVEADVPLP
jgi:hypothetical protein